MNLKNSFDRIPNNANNNHLENEEEKLELNSIARAIRGGAKNLERKYDKKYVMDEVSQYCYNKGLKFLYKLEPLINFSNPHEKAIYESLVKEKIKNLKDQGVTEFENNFLVPEEFIKKYDNAA